MFFPGRKKYWQASRTVELYVYLETYLVLWRNLFYLLGSYTWSCLCLLVNLFLSFLSFAVDQFFFRSSKRRPQPDLHTPHRLVQRAGVTGDERGRRHRNPQGHHWYGDAFTSGCIPEFWFLSSPGFKSCPPPTQAVFPTASETASTKSSLSPRCPGGWWSSSSLKFTLRSTAPPTGRRWIYVRTGGCSHRTGVISTPAVEEA